MTLFSMSLPGNLATFPVMRAHRCARCPRWYEGQWQNMLAHSGMKLLNVALPSANQLKYNCCGCRQLWQSAQAPKAKHRVTMRMPKKEPKAPGGRPGASPKGPKSKRIPKGVTKASCRVRRRSKTNNKMSCQQKQNV